MINRTTSVQPLHNTPGPTHSASLFYPPTTSASSSSRVPTLRGADVPHRDTRSGGAPSLSVPTPPGEDRGRSYPSEKSHKNLSASSHGPEHATSVDSSSTPLPTPPPTPTLNQPSASASSSAQVVAETASTSTSVPLSSSGGMVEGKPHHDSRRGEASSESALSPDKNEGEAYPSPSELGHSSDSVPLGRTEGLSTSPPPPDSVRPLKSTRSLRQQEGRGPVSPSEQNRAGLMMTEIHSSPGNSFKPKHSAPPPPSAQASPALTGPVPGAGTPTEVRDKPTKPSGTTYFIFSLSPLGLLESTFSPNSNSIHIHSTQITTFSRWPTSYGHHYRTSFPGQFSVCLSASR
jgi:hypothetical protein